MQLVATRAGLSVGGLFRQFPTRAARMVSTAEDAAKKILEKYTRSFESLRGTEEPITLALEIPGHDAIAHQPGVAGARPRVPDRSGAEEGARDDGEALRGRDPGARAKAPAGSGRLDGRRFRLLVSTVVMTFDGEQMHRIVLSDPQADRARLEALAKVARVLGGK